MIATKRLRSQWDRKKAEWTVLVLRVFMLSEARGPYSPVNHKSDANASLWRDPMGAPLAGVGRSVRGEAFVCLIGRPGRGTRAHG